jgi:hypothetical protein
MRWILLILYLSPSPAPAQRIEHKESMWARWEGWQRFRVTSDPSLPHPQHPHLCSNRTTAESQRGGVAEVFAGVDLFEFVTFEADYNWSRNHASLVSTTNNTGATTAYQQQENLIRTRIWSTA